VESREIPSKKIHLKTYKKSITIKNFYMADISEIRLQYTEAKRMPTDVEGCQKTPTKTPHRERQKENDC
jgi:hypothetical protein